MTQPQFCYILPFALQLFEYFNLFNFFRPNVLGHLNEAKFEREYVKPIAWGMSSNCSLDAYCTSLTKSKELNAILDPFVHRVDSSELRKDLPPMQQVVVHVRQTSLQSRLYRAYKRHQRDLLSSSVNYYNSFLKHFSLLRPVHNHPVRITVPPSQELQLPILTILLFFHASIIFREVFCLYRPPHLR